MKKVFDILNEDDDEFFESMSKGHLGEYMMGVVEFYEENFYFEKMVNDIRNGTIEPIHDLNMRVYKKMRKICQDLNILYLEDIKNADKDSSKELLKRFWNS